MKYSYLFFARKCFLKYDNILEYFLLIFKCEVRIICIEKTIYKYFISYKDFACFIFQYSYSDWAQVLALIIYAVYKIYETWNIIL